MRASNTKLLLKYLATGGFITILSLANPQLPYYIIKAYLKNRRFRKDRFSQDLKRLQRRELIDYEVMSNGEIKIVLSVKGKKLALQYKIDNMAIPKPKKWDGRWRLIIFDIPDKKRSASNALGLKLKELGFYKLQKSVWIYPYICDKEVEFIAAIFDIRKHILILNVSGFEDDEKLKHHFKI